MASTYLFLGSVLITGSVHTYKEKVSTKPLILLIKALYEGLSAILPNTALKHVLTYTYNFNF